MRLPSSIHLRRPLTVLLLLLLAALVVPALSALPLTLHAASADIPEAPPMDGHLVYTRGNSTPGRFSIDVFAADADGDNESQITVTDDVKVYGSAKGEDSPRWSPDGREVAFISADRNGLVSIWRVPFNGGTPTPVVTADGEGGDPAWSPNGECIAFAGAHVGAGASTLDLKVKCADGSTRTILNTGDIDERGPDWAPDGSQIAYESRQPPPSYQVRTDWSLRTVKPDGSGDALLLDWPDTSLRFPRWSPDGMTVAFVAGLPYGLGTLYALDVASGTLTSLVGNVAGPPAWSPDGTKIAFYNTRVEGPQVAGAAAPILDSPQEEQLLGLYVIDVADKSLARLHGAAGGANARLDSFEWGYSSDWTAGTATMTPVASDTPTSTATATITPTPTATSTSTATPSPSPNVGSKVFLPAAYRSWPTGPH